MTNSQVILNLVGIFALVALGILTAAKDSWTRTSGHGG